MSVKKSWPDGHAPYLKPDGCHVAIALTPMGKKLSSTLLRAPRPDPVTKWDRRFNKGGTK